MCETYVEVRLAILYTLDFCLLVMNAQLIFRKFVLAPGKQGYQNRKQLYDALYADGAVSSSSYEDLNSSIFK